jgi:polyisoprenyl-teichoic acid--peptidoglycan teichoic acid transferase
MLNNLKRRSLLQAGMWLPLSALDLQRTIRRTLAKDNITPAEIDALTVLVGGLDSREPAQPENADVFIIARVDVPNGTVRAVSVPRDLYVEIPGFGFDKITRTYDFGSKANGGAFKSGAATMTETVALNFGVEADAVVVTTFGGFQEVIDALDGIDLDNPYDLYDAEYPTVEYGMEEVYFPAGPIHLTGADALKFVRTRHQDGDDGRVMRQHLVLLALLDRVRQGDVIDSLPDLVEAYRKTVRNNLGVSKRLALALAAPSFSEESIFFTDLNQFVYGDTTSEGMWIYSGDWSQIPGYVQGFLNGEL